MDFSFEYFRRRTHARTPFCTHLTSNQSTPQFFQTNQCSNQLGVSHEEPKTPLAPACWTPSMLSPAYTLHMTTLECGRGGRLVCSDQQLPGKPQILQTKDCPKSTAVRVLHEILQNTTHAPACRTFLMAASRTNTSLTNLAWEFETRGSPIMAAHHLRASTTVFHAPSALEANRMVGSQPMVSAQISGNSFFLQ